MSVDEKDSNNITIIHNHSDVFRAIIFYKWYTTGAYQKYTPRRFYDEILSPADRIDPVDGRTVTYNEVNNLIKNIRAKGWVFDQDLADQIQQQVVSDRVEIIQRQVPILQELQELAVKVLRSDTGEKMSARDAIRLYFEAAREERLARNIDLEDYEKISNMREADLLETMQRLADAGVIDSADTTEQAQATGATE